MLLVPLCLLTPEKKKKWKENQDGKDEASVFCMARGFTGKDVVDVVVT